MGLIGKYGERWPRNEENIKVLKTEDFGDPEGIYILYDGSMPLYIGKGRIRRRVRGHRKSDSKGRYWDYFSWYEIRDKKLRHEVESILLRLLPFYLRSLNKNRGKLPRSLKKHSVNKQPELIEKDNRPPNRRRKS